MRSLSGQPTRLYKLLTLDVTNYNQVELLLCFKQHNELITIARFKLPVVLAVTEKSLTWVFLTTGEGIVGSEVTQGCS